MSDLERSGSSIPIPPEVAGACWVPLRRGDGSVRAWTLIDADEYDSVTQRRWHLVRGRAARSLKIDGTRRAVFLARQILRLDLDDPRHVDHINRDRLDNRRANLRTVTNAQNLQNVGSRPGSRSRFRGVSWDKNQGGWQVKAMVAGRNHFLGRFDDEVEAARVADAFRLEHMPFATPDPELAALGLGDRS